MEIIYAIKFEGYLLMFLLGSISCCMSAKSLMYFEGNFSQEDLSLDTAACPKPEMMANIELKFWVSLHWWAKGLVTDSIVLFLPFL